MRLLITNVLATALVLFGAASASAYAVQMTTTHAGGALGVGDTVELSVFLDTEGQSDIQLLSVSVLFNNAVFGAGYAFDSPTYMLYVPVGRGYNVLQPAAQNGNLRVGTTDQILLDWTNSDPLPSGNAGSGIARMATITFTVANATGNPAAFSLITDGPGNVFQTGPPGNAFPALGSSGDFIVNTVPEPTTAVLVGLGLLGLGVAGWRRE